MLTEEQKRQFRLAVSQQNTYPEHYESIDPCDPCDVICENSDVVETRETVADFAAAQKRAGEKIEVPAGTVYRWDNVQRAKGSRRGTLFVQDFGEFRAAYFSGD